MHADGEGESSRDGVQGQQVSPLPFPCIRCGDEVNEDEDQECDFCRLEPGGVEYEAQSESRPTKLRGIDRLRVRIASAILGKDLWQRYEAKLADHDVGRVQAERDGNGALGMIDR